MEMQPASQPAPPLLCVTDPITFTVPMYDYSQPYIQSTLGTQPPLLSYYDSDSFMFHHN
jgi:hypothetical protein